MRRLLPLTIAAALFASSGAASAHGGKTDDQGCHVDSRAGTAHCHAGIKALKDKLKEREQQAKSGELDLSKVEKARRVKAKVTEIIDGDTIEARVGAETWTIRIVGIDCPEKNENAKCSKAENCDPEAGAKATAKLTEVIGGAEVELVALGPEFTRDRYQRVLAYVEHQATDVGLFMVRGGYCEDYSQKYPHPRMGWYKKRLRGVPNEAKAD